MLFKNKFKKPDTDALKNEGTDAVKKAEKDPQGTAEDAKNLSKKNPLGQKGASGSGDDAAEGLGDEGLGDEGLGGDGFAAGGAGSKAGADAGAGSGATSSPRVARGGSGRRAPVQEPEEEYGGGGYADDAEYAGQNDAYGAGGYSRNVPQSAASPGRQQAAQRSRGNRYHHGHGTPGNKASDFAGAEGGVGDPEDELETPHQHSEYVPGSQYGTPASPRKAPTGAPAGAYDPAEEGGAYGSEVPARSPRRTPSSKTPSRNTSRKTRGGDEGGVAGGGATSGAGGYGHDHPDYQDRDDWDRRHAKKSFFPFRRHHHSAPGEEAEQIGGATSVGDEAGAGGAGAKRPSQAPVRTGSKGRGTAGTAGTAGTVGAAGAAGTGGPAAGATTGKNSAAVAGADAAVQRAGGNAGGAGKGLGAADAAGGNGAGAGGGLTSKAKDLAGNEQVKGKVGEVAGNKQLQGKAGDLAGKAGIPKNVKDVPGIGKAADAAGIPGGATGAQFAATGAAGALGSNLNKFGGQKNGATDEGGDYAGAGGDGAGGYGADAGGYGADSGGYGASGSKYGRGAGADAGRYGSDAGGYGSSGSKYGRVGGRGGRGGGYGGGYGGAPPSDGGFDYDEINGDYPAGNRRYPHRGPATATSASKRSSGYDEPIESRAAAHGHSSHAHNDGYQGGYEAGYAAARRGERSQQGVSSPSSRGAGGLTGTGAAAGGSSYGRSRGYGGAESDPAGGFSRTAGAEDASGAYSGGDSSGLGTGVGGASGDKGYGKEESDPAGGFSRTAGIDDSLGDFSERGAPDSGLGAGGLGGYDRQAEAGGYSKTAGMADDTLVGTTGGSGSGYGSKSKFNPFKQGQKDEALEYTGTGAERYGAHDPNYSSEGDRSGGNLGGSEAYGYGKGSSPADEFFDEDFGHGGSRGGVGKYETKTPSYGSGNRNFKDYGTGDNYGYDDHHPSNGKGNRARDQFGRDPAGYQKSPGGAVGPGADEYPEDYDDLRNPGAGKLGTRRAGSKGRGSDGARRDDSRGVSDRDSSTARKGGSSGAVGGDGLGGLAAGGVGAAGAAGATGTDAAGGGDSGDGGIAGGLSKTAHKAAGNENIKGSLDKAGGIGKGKAGDLAKDKLGGGKAAQFAGKAKDVPGANDAKGTAQEAVDRGISSKLGNAGSDGVGAAGGDAAGAAGAAGSGGFRKGGSGDQRGTGRDDSPGDYGDDQYGYDDDVPRQGVSGGADDGVGHGTGRYGGAGAAGGSPRGLNRGGSTHRPAYDDYDDYSPADDERSYGRAPRQGEPSTGVYDRKYVQDRNGRRVPSGPSGAYDKGHDYSSDRMVSSGGGTNQRLRRGYGGEGDEEKQLGPSNGDTVPGSQEFDDQRGDNFDREASADSSAYYDSSETVPGTEEQAATGAEKTARGQPIRKTKQPSLSKPTDARGQDTSIPRLGFQGLFGRKKSAGGIAGDEGTQSAGSRKGSLARRFSMSKRKSANQDQLGEPFETETEGGEPVTRTRSSKTKNSANSPRSRRGLEPTSPSSKGTPSIEKQNNTSKSKRSSSGESASGTSEKKPGGSPASPTGGPQTDEGKRFAETFGNFPSLIDPSVPTYGWGTHSEGPPTGPNDSGGGGAPGQGGGTQPMGTVKPNNLPVMRNTDPGSSKSTKKPSSSNTSKKTKKGGPPSPSTRGPDGEGPSYGETQGLGDEEGNNNYVTSHMPDEGRTESVGSYGVDDDVAGVDNRDPVSPGQGYYNNDVSESRNATGLGEDGEPTSIYGDEDAYNYNEASKVPRGGPDEVEQVAQDARSAAPDSGKGEPGILGKIKNTIMPGSHGDAATAV